MTTSRRFSSAFNPPPNTFDRSVTRRPRTETQRWLLRVVAYVVAPVALALAGFSLANTSVPTIRQAAHLPRFAHRPTHSPSASSATSSALAPAAPADAKLDRSAYSLVGSGVLFVPTTFHSHDGTFDLLVFFHGNAELVAKSAAAAKLNALVLVVNLGISSGAYESHYFIPAMFQRDIDRVVEGATSRGLMGARVGRLALGAWSAGYGALLRILTYEAVRSKASAVLLADALHSNLTKDGYARTVDLERIAPFIQFAKNAAAEDKLFVMTHSEVNEFRYATTTETSDALIDAVGTFRSRSTDWPDCPTFPLARQVMSTERWLNSAAKHTRATSTCVGTGATAKTITSHTWHRSRRPSSRTSSRTGRQRSRSVDVNPRYLRSLPARRCAAGAVHAGAGVRVRRAQIEPLTGVR